MPRNRVPTSRPRGRPPVRGRSAPLEGVTERRRYLTQSEEQRQLRFQERRQAERFHREQGLNARRLHFVRQNNSVPSPYLFNLRQIINARRQQHKLPKTYCSARLFLYEHEVQTHSVGDMDKVCVHCAAKLFPGEFRENTATLCCHKGKILLEPIQVCEELKTLIELNDGNTKNYLDNIRQFNNALAFASVNVESLKIPGRGPYCFKLHGQVYHMVGNLQPPIGTTPTYAGLFILDFDTALQHRTDNEINRNCRRSLMAKLQAMLDMYNPYAQLFKYVKDVAHSAPNLQLQFTTNNAFHHGRSNAPTVSEVAAVFVSNDGTPPANVDFVMHSKGTGQLTKIPYLNPHSDPMCYPLLFNRGDSGWSTGRQHVTVHATALRTTTTQLQYYCYRLAVRDGFSILHASGKLFQQYVVDSYVKVEGSRLAFIQSHQKELRAENYKGLIDFLNSDAQQRGQIGGIPVVLPSTYIGSPRNMLQNYQDAMAIVAHLGKPDLFVTFTCNPKWPEITSQLKPYERVEHRPDLVSRVFHLKLQALLNVDILKNHVLGVVIGFVSVIEFQKRGLPHAHILLILSDEDKLRSAEDVNSLICAEIPNKETEPELFQVIQECMVHGPCGVINPNSPCMKEDQCIKGYPKNFLEETNLNVDGYPMYMRRDNGVTMDVRSFTADNRWIVPYCRFLSKKYHAHINVENCSSVKSVKYLYKYVYKGHDCAALRLQSDSEGQEQLIVNEVDIYLNCRYVSSPEAMWRLHERRLFQRSHTIERLPVHLPEEQMIYFQAGREADVDRDKESKLMAFFTLCAENVTARQYLYHEIPKHFVWSRGQWNRRQKNSKCLGRIYTVNPADIDRYYLRVLLLHVKGPQSFEDLRTVDGILCDSFRQAAEKLHLVINDAEWKECLQEAVGHQMPTQLRWLFAIICIFCAPSNIPKLWRTFQGGLSEDFLRHHTLPEAQNLTLLELEKVFKQHNKSCEKLNLPIPVAVVERDPSETYDVQAERTNGNTAYEKLNEEQKAIVDEVLRAVQNNIHSCYFIDGPGGSGKTFLYTTLCHILRGEKKNVSAVAWTGIAANLLPGGRTSHSLFKLPVPILDNSRSSIRPHSKDGQLLRETNLIIWDEVSMVPKDALRVVDRLLKEIMKNNLPFGGKIILFGGDFRQVLPVLRNASRTSIVENSVKCSPLWSHVKTRRLTQNMRANDDPVFTDWLLSLGNGTLEIQREYPNDAIKIPKHCYCDYDSLIATVFNAAQITDQNVSQFYSTAILCPKNDDCTNINDYVISNLLPGDEKVYFSSDSVEEEETTGDQLYPLEFLNSLNPSGLPPHKLLLKKNTIIMLIRNLNAKHGLINGARLLITNLGEYSITAKFLDSDKTAIIPRIILTPSDSTMPFKLVRKQFPIKVAFAMTINKAQGQTLTKAGLYLPQPVFSHGQLYVAFSRVKQNNDIRVCIKDTYSQKVNDDHIITSNIVYKEVL